MSFAKIKLLLLLSLAIAFACSAVAQNAFVKVRVEPPQAYIFADGNAWGSGHRTLELTPGHHTIAVYNYGYNLRSVRWTWSPVETETKS